MPWHPLSRIAFAVCSYPFQPSAPADLPLEIGDELYVIEQGGEDGSWYRGYLVAPPSLLAGLTSVKGQTLEARVFSGIFPKACVEVREVLGEDKAHGHGRNLDSRGSGAAAKGDGHAVNGASVDATSDRSQEKGAIVGGQKLPKAESKSPGSGRGAKSQPLGFPMPPTSAAQTPQQTSSEPDAARPPAPVPMLKVGDETPMSTSEPLVDEIASCLREWHSTNLHELLLARRYSSLDKMSRLVRRLDVSRKQLLYGVLTTQELGSLRESTVWDLVSGNKLLSGDVVVRSAAERGRILTADDSAIEMTCLQSMMSLLDEKPTPHVDTNTLHHLLVDIKGFAGHLEPAAATISMYLCTKSNAEPPKDISEVYSVDLGSSTAGSEGKMRTLFVDLSAADIGEGLSSASSMYLVCKVLTSEPIKATALPSSPRESTSSNTPPISPSNYGSVKSGRRSVMWGQRARKESSGSIKAAEANAAVNGDLGHGKGNQARPGTSMNGKSSSSKDSKLAKRTVGIGVIQIDALMRNNTETEQEMMIWTACSPQDQGNNDGSWDSIISEILPNPTNSYKKSNLTDRLTIYIKGFSMFDAGSLIRQTPTLLHKISETRKIGFSGAPTRPRSDIYITLKDLLLPANAFLSHPKTGTVPLGAQNGLANLQLTLEVRKSTGERMEGCIFPSCNSAGHTAWRTTTVEKGEAWNTTIRLAIHPDDVPGSHIVMSVADAPGFPFALCWMPLWNQDAFIRDGDYSLAFYKYDEYTSSMISGRGAYLALPWASKRKDELPSVPLAALRLRTYLCSTQYSQDPTLLGLLKWREQYTAELLALLRRVVFVPEMEIVKLLNPVFDALFEILVEYAGSAEHEDLVFNALVIVLGIVNDRRFNLGPLVDLYTEERFNYPYATSSLLRSYHRLLSNPADPEASRRLRATFKVGGHVLKFIISAQEQQRENGGGVEPSGRPSTLKNDLQDIFKAVEQLLQNPAPSLIGTKTLIVQNFHSWLSPLSVLMSPTEILGLVGRFIDCCAAVQGKLILYKLVLIIHVGQEEVFRAPEIRRLLLARTSGWLAPYWGHTNHVTEQWKEQVRLCCSVVASQINDLGAEAGDYIPKLVNSYRAIQSTARSAKSSLSLLFPTAYPFPSRPSPTSAVFDEALVEIAALLAATASLPTTVHFESPETDLADFVFDVLKVYMSILDCDAFPKSWLSVHVYHHRSIMRSLERVSSVLIDVFLPLFDEAHEFNTELWRAFFDTLLKLVGSDALALETFPEQKRRAVWKIAGDVREQGAELLRRSWEAIGWETSLEEKKRYGIEKMGGFQVQYVPGLVAPIVELCLSVHEGVRTAAIGVLQTMIISEWSLSQDLSIIQAEMIDCLDTLFKVKHPKTESTLQKLVIGELMALFEPLAEADDDALFAAVKNLIGTIDELLDLLVAVHCTDGTGEAFHIMDTLHLMEFLRDVQKEDIYIRYVHQLASLQSDGGNSAEAGLALRLHADLYEWDPSRSLPPLNDPEFPPQSAFERKEQLFFQMIKHFEDDMSWHNALGAYTELAEQYQHNIFDFSKLARTQRAMATIYESISKGETRVPRYFRVVYKGLGFPAVLRDKQFIFVGSSGDRLSSFTDKMQQQHPSAQILTAGATDDLEGQYLQIYAVSPQKDVLHPIYQRSKVGQALRDHCLLSTPNRFATTSRRQVSETGVAGRVVDKTVYATAECFPTILRRSEIVSTEKITLTPLQAAVERTTRKTSELVALEQRAHDGDDAAMAALTEALTVSVDGNSDAGVSNYKALLPNEDAVDADDESEAEVQLDPLERALKVALLDHVIVVKRCLSLYNRPAHEAMREDLTQSKSALPMSKSQIGLTVVEI